MSELKPCPFCGDKSTPYLYEETYNCGVKAAYYVSCDCCGACGGSADVLDCRVENEKGRQRAIEAWNTRPGEAAAVAETKRRALELCRDGTKVWCLDDLIKAIEAMEPEKSCNSKQE